MGDLTRIDAAGAIEITDGIGTSAAVTTTVTGSEAGLVVREGRTGQQDMNASIPVVIASNQPGSLKLEDQAHSSGSYGAFVLAVRNDGATATLTSDDGDYSPIAVDAQGRIHVVGSFSATPAGTQTVVGTVTSVPSGTQTVVVSGTVTTAGGGGGGGTEYAEDSTHTTGAFGPMILAVRNDGATATLTSADGDYSPIAVDAQGRIHVVGSFSATPSGTQTVVGTVTSVPSGTQTVVGTVTSVPSGTQAVSGTVTSVASSGTRTVTGTVTSVPSGTQTVTGSVTSVPSGTQGVSGTVTSVAGTGTRTVVGTVTSVPSGTQTVAVTGTVTTTGGGGGGGTEYAEDSTHTTGDLGTMMLAVRNDGATATLTSADGDYSPIAVDAQGRVYVTSTPSGTQTVVGTVTSVPSGTQGVSGTVTSVASSGTRTVTGTVTSVPSGTQGVSGTITSVASSGTRTVVGTVTSVAGTGTRTVTGTVNSVASSGTRTVVGTVTSVPSGTQGVSGTVTSVASSGTRTVVGTVTSVPSGTQTVAVTGTVTTAGGGGGGTEYAEDSTHTTGDLGTMMLAVRNDNISTTLTSANGDYSAVAVDVFGRIWTVPQATQTVAGTVTSVPSGTQSIVGTITSVASSGTRTVGGSVTSIPSGTQSITGTVTSVAGTGTRTITGDVAHDSSDSGSPIKIGARATTTNPTAVSSGDRAHLMCDDQGRLVVLQNHVRDLVVSNMITLSTTTETTLLSAGGAGVYHDLVTLTISNWSNSNVRVDIRDSTSGTVRLSFCVAAAGGGAVIPFPVPLPQTTANANWTAQLDAAASDIRVFAQAVKNV